MEVYEILLALPKEIVFEIICMAMPDDTFSKYYLLHCVIRKSDSLEMGGIMEEDEEPLNLPFSRRDLMNGEYVERLLDCFHYFDPILQQHNKPSKQVTKLFSILEESIAYCYQHDTKVQEKLQTLNHTKYSSCVFTKFTFPVLRSNTDSHKLLKKLKYIILTAGMELVRVLSTNVKASETAKRFTSPNAQPTIDYLVELLSKSENGKNESKVPSSKPKKTKAKASDPVASIDTSICHYCLRNKARSDIPDLWFEGMSTKSVCVTCGIGKKVFDTLSRSQVISLTRVKTPSNVFSHTCFGYNSKQHFLKREVMIYLNEQKESTSAEPRIKKVKTQ
ncbi:hypothetical protein C9374_000477 [Naegleria lovaniensis]|uniref:Uncharacterized protein n=1 Tax=Naegleria lovaniensis TaxID=51637 RepID=A0AA88KN93_NAELO|nr:uncharacterized protein C9374_000477 [Naegleria lovaniensis]KAG2388313.1 hypothetical protein C9374_000477 [Naegleria lovaniensis]